MGLLFQASGKEWGGVGVIREREREREGGGGGVFPKFNNKS